MGQREKYDPATGTTSNGASSGTTDSVTLEIPGLLDLDALQKELDGLYAEAEFLKYAGRDDASVWTRINEILNMLEPRDASESLDEGGETWDVSTVIYSLPYCDSGNTNDYINNYGAPIPDCSPSVPGARGKDVVYVYIAGAEDEVVSISLCGSSYDTYLHVCRNGPPSTGSVAYACNDDNGGTCPAGTNSFRSCISNLTLTAADTFWIVVDGWNTNSNGAYQLFMDHDIRCAGCPPPPPCVECPAGAYVSIEPTCFNGYEDQTNVGCVAAADYATDNVGNIFQGATEQILGLNLPAGTYFVATSTFAWTDNPCGEIRLTIESDVPLPAELTSFDAVPGDRKITLSWSTGSESNLDHFSLMRNGALIAEVNANNSATGGSYTWTDIGLTNGTTYEYTLVSMDLDGASNTLGTQSAAPNAGNASVTEYALYQNYPNPFNPETSISFDLVEDGPVKLTVFNSLGQSVAVLVDGLLTAGRHTVTFDGSALTSGLYFYRLDAADFTANHKMVLMK